MYSKITCNIIVKLQNCYSFNGMSNVIHYRLRLVYENCSKVAVETVFEPTPSYNYLFINRKVSRNTALGALEETFPARTKSLNVTHDQKYCQKLYIYMNTKAMEILIIFLRQDISCTRTSESSTIVKLCQLQSLFLTRRKLINSDESEPSWLEP